MSAAAGLRPAVSVIIPTHRRQDKIVETVAAVDEQSVPGSEVEIVVVVDGRFDDTAQVLRAQQTRLPLTVAEQSWAGQGAARNHGARLASGEIAVFLDDDVTVKPGFLAALLDEILAGADVVVARLEIAELGPPSIRGRELTAWFDTVAADMDGGEFSAANMVFSATAVRLSLFERVGGFDEEFTAGGAYGAEDGELGHRLLQAGAVVRLASAARASTDVEADPATSLARAYDMGSNHVRLVRKHPELREDAFDEIRLGSRIYRMMERAVAVAPFVPILLTPFAWATTRLVRHRGDGPLVHRLLLLCIAAAFWRGVHDAGGIPAAGAVRVLCYHSLSDVGDDDVLAGYGVERSLLARQLTTLRRAGYTFVTPKEALAVFSGGKVPRRAVLLTFDDAYADLAEAASLIEQLAVPGVIFAVTEELGGSNQWDQARGAPRLPLLDVEALATLNGRGWEIGSHSRTHAYLSTLDDQILAAEVGGSRDDLEARGLRPRLFAYPHGDHDARVARMVADAGYLAAFTVCEGVATATDNPFTLPRLEIYPWDVGSRLIAKVATGGRSEKVRNALGRQKRQLLRR